VDSGEWLTRRVLYADDMGSETVVQFTHIRLNPDLPSGTFTLSAPEGVEVVDLR